RSPESFRTTLATCASGGLNLGCRNISGGEKIVSRRETSRVILAPPLRSNPNLPSFPTNNSPRRVTFVSGLWNTRPSFDSQSWPDESLRVTSPLSPYLTSRDASLARPDTPVTLPRASILATDPSRLWTVRSLDTSPV